MGNKIKKKRERENRIREGKREIRDVKENRVEKLKYEIRN